MATTAAADLEALRERVHEELAARLPTHLKRLTWNAERLAVHQRDCLRRLLSHAIEHSRFHARRLHGVVVDRIEVSDLPALPVMTKADMMAEFDHVVTDQRLGIRAVERHLSASKK